MARNERKVAQLWGRDGFAVTLRRLSELDEFLGPANRVCDEALADAFHGLGSGQQLFAKTQASHLHMSVVCRAERQ